MGVYQTEISRNGRTLLCFHIAKKQYIGEGNSSFYRWITHDTLKVKDIKSGEGNHAIDARRVVSHEWR
jgi:hypothetical protein